MRVKQDQCRKMEKNLLIALALLDHIDTKFFVTTISFESVENIL